MSRKYERMKSRDERLPAPARVLLRMFSSIELAVALLGFVLFWGFLGTLPIGPLPTWGFRAVLFAVSAAGGVLLFRAAGSLSARRLSPRAQDAVTLFSTFTGIALGILLGVLLHRLTADWTLFPEFFRRYHATTVYELPAFEMTELEFYGAWPLTTLLVLLVVNMIVATLRRVEFRLEKAGVLMAHGGIVLLAIGCLLYSTAKVEGDVLLFRGDREGREKSFFYDRTDPALYLTRVETGDELMIPLDDLPRYNDRLDGDFVLKLEEHPGFQRTFGTDLRAAVDGFIACGRQELAWVEGNDTSSGVLNPTIRARITAGDVDVPGVEFVMVARDPDQRAYSLEAFDIAYRVGPPDAVWLADSTSTGRDRFLIAQPEAGTFDGAQFLWQRADGTSGRRPLRLGDTVDLIDVEGRPLVLVVDEFMKCATIQRRGVPVPREERDPREEGTYRRALLAVTLSSPNGEGELWERQVWLPHVLYLEAPEEGFAPRRFEVPGIGTLELAFGRLRRELPVTLGLESFELLTYRGTDIPRDYRSTLRITGNGSAVPDGERLVTRLNTPVKRAGYKFSQSGWDPENQAYTILGVGNNPGIGLIAAGAVITCLGIPASFFVRPRLRRRRLKHSSRNTRIDAGGKEEESS